MTTASRAFATAVLLLCCVLPLLWLSLQVVANPSSLAFLRLDAFRAGLLARTIGYNAVAAVIATALAIPAALVVGRGRGVVPAVLLFLIPITLLLPSLAYAYGWAQLVRLLSAPAGRMLWAIVGDCSPALDWLGINLVGQAADARAFLTPAGRADVARCVWALAAWLWALPAGVIGLALRRLDATLQQQAMIDGALWRVTARQLVGPVVASVACVTVLATQEFAVYEPTGISVVATEVRQVFTTGAFSSPDNPITAVMGPGADWGGNSAAEGTPSSVATSPVVPHDTQRLAAAASVATALPLVLITGVLGIVAVWGVRRVGAAEDVDAEGWPSTLDAGIIAKSLALLAVGVTLVVPIVALLLRLQRPIDPLFIWRQSGQQILGSLALGSMAGAAALLVAAAAIVRRQRWAMPVALVAFLVGGQLLAIALIRLYNRPRLEWVYNAPPIMVMAYLARFGWLVLLAAGVTWGRPWQRLREMAAVDGAGPGQVARHVVWPLAWPLLLASGVLVMILSLTEVPATVLISPLRPQPIVPMLMTWVHTLESDPMIEASLLLMAVVVALAAVAAGLAWVGARRRRLA